MTNSPLRRSGSSCYPTLILPFVYFAGNLAHTKGKGVNTLRSPRTPTRTITFAKVLTAPPVLPLYYLLHPETSPEKLSIFFTSLLLNNSSPSLCVDSVFHFCSFVNCNYSFFCSYLVLSPFVLLSLSLCLCISVVKDGSPNLLQFFFFQ